MWGAAADVEQLVTDATVFPTAVRLTSAVAAETVVRVRAATALQTVVRSIAAAGVVLLVRCVEVVVEPSQSAETATPPVVKLL